MLADLLMSSVEPNHLSILTTESAAPILRERTSAGIHPIISEKETQIQTYPHVARWAVTNDVRNMVVAKTRVETAINAISRLDGGVQDAFAGGNTTGIQMLPEDVLKIHSPFANIDEAHIDSLLSTSPCASRDNWIEKSEVQIANHLMGSEDLSVSALLDHARNRAEAISFLREESDAVIRQAVLEASHWGYLVVRRSSLLEAYQSGRGGRVVAIHAMCRMAMHVSGSPAMMEADDENITRLIDTLLEITADGMLTPLPKGRTVGGMVVRPATGRFAKRILQTDRRFNKRKRETWQEQPEDLMILTREPDHESGPLYATRLRGNPSCSPLSPNGTPVYWDNRFVITAAPVSELEHTGNPFNATEIYKAVLACTGEAHPKELKEAELYIRQIRRTDWEKITAITSRVRDFQVPYECIRALPAIFQKEAGSSSLGALVASPHLGLSSRPDLYFTAVRMPKFRSLPADIDPGFREQHFESLHGRSRIERRRAPTRSRRGNFARNAF